MASKLAEKKKQEIATPLEAPKLVISAEDFNIPRMNLIQKISNIEGPVGGFVLDRKHAILDKGLSASTVIVRADKFWRENVPYDSDQIARIAHTEAQKKEIEADADQRMIKCVDFVLLIAQVEDADEELFPYDLGGTNYALVNFQTQKDGFDFTFGRLATSSLANPDLPLCGKFWNVQSELLTKGKNSWFVPTLEATKEITSEEVRDFVVRIAS
tara:strand:- start:376 stop:1017 length:642 start_codon:yes stop_codon:yes gene_type:complete